MEFDFVILDETESTNSEALKLAKSTDRPTLVVAKNRQMGGVVLIVVGQTRAEISLAQS